MDLMFIPIGIGILSYFIPWFVAWGRNHPQVGAIFVVNLFLGWTIVGWVVSLAWSVMPIDSAKQKTAKPVHSNTVLRGSGNYDFGIVGENRFSATLDELYRDWGPGPHKASLVRDHTRAQHRPDPSFWVYGPQGPRSMDVAVMILGRQVGYLSPEHARGFHETFDAHWSIDRDFTTSARIDLLLDNVKLVRLNLDPAFQIAIQTANQAYHEQY